MNIVIIPVYKNSIDIFEKKALLQCLKILSAHEICLVGPNGLDVSCYESLFVDINIPFRIEIFDNLYFGNIEGYNKLMLSHQFYDRFSSYDYMLIYQLDAYVFEDKLDYWCSKNYDYIGAPWLKPDLSFFQNCGNGGFSLRKISSFLSILSMPLDNKMFSLNGLYHYYQHRGLLHKVKLISEILLKKRNTMDYYVNVNPTNEDVFFSMLRWSINFKFKIPKPEEAALFSFETNPSLLYEKVGRKLPFGCHAWQKWEYDRFWSRYIK